MNRFAITGSRIFDGEAWHDDAALVVSGSDVETIRTICSAHAPFGTTALLVTLITDTREQTKATIAAGIEAARQKVPGFLGLHLEGPHLSVSRKGAHDPQLIRPMEDADQEMIIAARQELAALL